MKAGTLTMIVKVKFTISFWQAIKLRIAGPGVQKLVNEIVDRMQSETLDEQIERAR